MGNRNFFCKFTLRFPWIFKSTPKRKIWRFGNMQFYYNHLTGKKMTPHFTGKGEMGRRACLIFLSQLIFTPSHSVLM